MARSNSTYRGERRLAWKEQSTEPWSKFTLPPHGKLTLLQVERQQQRAEGHRITAKAAFDRWVLNLRAKINKRFALSKRELHFGVQLGLLKPRS